MPLYGLSVLLDLVCDIAVLVFDLLAGLLVAQVRVCDVVARGPAAELADQHDRPRRLRRARPAVSSKPRTGAGFRDTNKRDKANGVKGARTQGRAEDTKSERVRVCVCVCCLLISVCQYLFRVIL